MQVGVREFRSNLRRFLDAVRAGQEVTITDRGLPVARLIKADAKSPLQRLIDEGVVTLPTHPKTPSRYFNRVKAKGLVSDLVKEQRR